MLARHSLVVVVLLGVLGCPTANPPASKCEGVRCTGTDVCDPATGSCVGRASDAGLDAGQAADAGRDAGAADAGSNDAGLLDAGAGDAGSDAGVADAGRADGGPSDAGPRDAGLDAGAPECVDDFDCFGVRNRCDTSVGRCVECLVDAHCPSAIPKCDVVRNDCVECLSNVDCANPRPTCRARACDDCLALSECGPGQSCELRFGDCVVLPDSCAAPQALQLADAGGTAYVMVDPSTALDDFSTSCGAGPDVVYALTLPATRDVTITARRAGAGTAVPTVALRAAPCLSGGELACDRQPDGGSAASLALTDVPAGSYFVILESPAGTSGRLELAVTAVPRPGAVPNDTCAAVEPLAFYGTRAVAVGSTVLATNDGVGPSCSPTANAGGADLVYSYSVDGGSNVVVTVRPLDLAFEPVVSVRPACASAMNELACLAATAPGQMQTLTLPAQPAGSYVVHVDSANSTRGAFQLDVTRTPIVFNDTCGAVQPLSFNGTVAAATGDTSYATNDNQPGDATPSCSASARSTGQDVVFSYTLTQPRDVTVSVTPTGASPELWPVLSIRSACADGAAPAEAACVSPNASMQARASIVNQPAGTYVVWVDSAAGTAGPFQLEVVTAAPTPPPANDSCASPQALTFSANVATVSGSTLQAANDNNPFDVSPTCSPSGRQNGRDVVYAFSLAAPQDVTIDVTPTATSLLRPALYVRSGSCGSQLLGDELVCLERVGPARAVLTNLAAGTYWVFVDGAGGTAGDFSLSVTRSAPTPPPSNDECAGALPLSFTNDVASIVATTFGASNSNVASDNAPACGADFIPRRWGRDLVYTYTLASAKDVEVRVTSGGGSAFAPVTYVRGAGQCTLGFAGNELACGASVGPGTAVVYLPNQAAGTYPLFVDSNSYDTGVFTLQVRQLPPTPPPSNDTCAAPIAVPLGATGVSGDTTGARDDYSIGSQPRYAPACGNVFMSGRDVVYSFTAPASGTFTATVEPQGAFDPALQQLNGGCSAAQCVRSANTAGPGGAEAIVFAATTGQTIFFVVDSVDAAAPYGFGRFTLRVQ
ncbi:MAG: hypothetical protein IAE78_04100 [Myxococcus sp.]|nr:hypothetical protein [Myxococcus sp.]